VHSYEICELFQLFVWPERRGSRGHRVCV
jgi:hypothetical protein